MKIVIVLGIVSKRVLVVRWRHQLNYINLTNSVKLAAVIIACKYEKEKAVGFNSIWDSSFWYNGKSLHTDLTQCGEILNYIVILLLEFPSILNTSYNI